jgi:hypothetical protein
MSDKITPAADIYAHLLPRGGVRQSDEDRAREAARRKGRARKNWWQSCPMQPVPESKPKPE